MNNPAIQIYGRISNTSEPVGGCHPNHCSLCLEPVWIPLADNENRNRLAPEKRPSIICRECADEARAAIKDEARRAAEEGKNAHTGLRTGVHGFRCGDAAIVIGPTENGEWKLGIGDSSADNLFATQISGIEFIADLDEASGKRLTELLNFMMLDAMFGSFVRDGETPEIARGLVRVMNNLADFDGARGRLSKWEESFVPQPKSGSET